MPDDDSTLRPITNARDVATRARGAVLSWLPTAKTCEECNIPCDATWTYDAQQAAFHAETGGKVPSWECPECETAYRREASSRLSFDIWE